MEGRQQLSDLLGLPLSCIPRGKSLQSMEVQTDTDEGSQRITSRISAARGSSASITAVSSEVSRVLPGILLDGSFNNLLPFSHESGLKLQVQHEGDLNRQRSLPLLGEQNFGLLDGKLRRAVTKLNMISGNNDDSGIACPVTPLSDSPNASKLTMLCSMFREFSALYGPVVLLLENLQDFDAYSWHLVKMVSESLSNHVLLIITTRPNNPEMASGQMLHSKAATYQRVAALYRDLLSLRTTTSIVLKPFNFEQAKQFMQV